MAEDLHLINASKEEQYLSLLPQIEGLIAGEVDLTANLANVCAALKAQFNFFWVGFYLVKGDELVLGPFQGPVACTRIAKGRGVCGQAWQHKQVMLVPDVDAFPDHIACSSLSKSEVVIPLFGADDEVKAVLDVDSDRLNDFDEIDVTYLSKLCSLLSVN
jgi:L-methionine (R)-S-oxide reductase